MNKVRRIIKRLSTPFLQRAQAFYMRKPRKYIYKEQSVWVMPGVFPPFLTLSTKILLDHLEGIDIAGKSLLELGCGSGIISVRSAARGAKVTATDINIRALEALRENQFASEIEILESDLFDALRGRNFDHIVINPPYYAKDTDVMAEKAWFCGSDFGYFRKLFAQLPDFLSAEVLMILSEDCDIARIEALASEQNLSLHKVLEKRSAGERNFIFRISASNPGS